MTPQEFIKRIFQDRYDDSCDECKEKGHVLNPNDVDFNDPVTIGQLILAELTYISDNLIPPYMLDEDNEDEGDENWHSN